MCQKKIKIWISETARLIKDAPVKSVLITSTEKVAIFLRNMEQSPQYRHFTCQIAISQNRGSHFAPSFGRPLSCALIHLKHVKKKLAKS